MNSKHKLFIIFSCIFALLLLWYPKSNSSSKYIEHMTTNQSNDINKALLLAMKNSAEISVLNKKVNELVKLNEKIKTLENETKNNTKYIDALQQDDVNVANNIRTQIDTED